ncbi:hypothetical protein F5B20DRAFT_525159 [Whalleya microplaca]|nr:hypothetical protein F5B20DRAFT_525159 [Whalleya microplaca]
MECFSCSLPAPQGCAKGELYIPSTSPPAVKTVIPRTGPSSDHVVNFTNAYINFNLIIRGFGLQIDIMSGPLLSPAQSNISHHAYGEQYYFLRCLPRSIFLRRVIVLTLLIVSLAGFLTMHRRSLLEYKSRSFDLPLHGFASTRESGLPLILGPWNSSEIARTWLEREWRS